MEKSTRSDSTLSQLIREQCQLCMFGRALAVPTSIPRPVLLLSLSAIPTDLALPEPHQVLNRQKRNVVSTTAMQEAWGPCRFKSHGTLALRSRVAVTRLAANAYWTDEV